MDLFSHMQGDFGLTLSEQLRPKSLNEIRGQKKLLSSKSQIRQLIEKGQIPNLILWGPPGTGKTSFAKALSSKTAAHFIEMNAVDAGSKALREAGVAGAERRVVHQQKTILFVDEIHRLNKGQQDVLLPFIEKGDLILVGATTENPSYELNKALLSRCRLLVFEKLSSQDLEEILDRAAEIIGFNFRERLSDDALKALFELADGDARRLINSLELIYNTPKGDPFSREALIELLQAPGLSYDKDSEMHYDLVSALIKSIRGSDPDAALYYMVRMLEGGEDPVFICRRLIILASEDVGNADPRALTLATSCLQAVEAVGLPEGAIPLSQTVLYLSTCPKSNRSYMALKAAQEYVQKTRSASVPLRLRSSKTEMSKSLGYGKDYRYPHSHPNAWVEQNYWPEELEPQKFYEPSPRGFEKNITEYQNWVKRKKDDEKS